MAKRTTKPQKPRREMTSAEVRDELAESLELDVIGPWPGSGYEKEMLSQNPFRWYLTGFLVPVDADEIQKADEESQEESAEEVGGPESPDGSTPEAPAAKLAFFPSSIGISCLLGKGTEQVKVVCRWGDYRLVPYKEGAGEGEDTRSRRPVWKRAQREETVMLPVPASTETPAEFDVPNSDGLKLSLTVRPADLGSEEDGGLPTGTRSASIFLVNQRRPSDLDRRDEAFAFQAQLEVQCEDGFVPRPDPRGITSTDWDERVADLQYRDELEFAVGHGVATKAERESATLCKVVRTAWIPRAEVEHVAPARVDGIELRMEELETADAAALKAKIGDLPKRYLEWIEGQRQSAPTKPTRRATISKQLLDRASHVAKRIGDGIAMLQDPVVLEAFQIANRTMAIAARQRNAISQGKAPKDVESPAWRPFQLAFLLVTLPAIVDPKHADRETLDLLFFPTGGGKTEAYLGLAAFTIALRRLRNKGLDGAGVSVLMRYTLRLLTLDQLNRAATLICALELERQKDPTKLGTWAIEIGLWVGQGATPNKVGKKGDKSQDTARSRVSAYKAGRTGNAPIPLGTCPWCGTALKPTCYVLTPNEDKPTDLRVYCANRDCLFTRNQPLPVVGVDEPIYRRLPAFLIATVDKFAALPWEGRVSALFGSVTRADAEGFYGAADPGMGSALPKGRLLPPELIIQDELHLISGPLGTMTGLYETALDELCTRIDGDDRIRPKIIASTATVRRADKQVLALFNRHLVEVFPPPGPDRKTSFFAETKAANEVQPRAYFGVAAQGRSPKVILLRSYLALMSAAQKLWRECGGKANKQNPVDPYMSMLGYFNSLRELGGSRRIIEDEIGPKLTNYGTRLRVDEALGWYADREINFEVLELTSRVSTSNVAEARRRLGLGFHEDNHVDVAIATNMISVGLDIPRLGMMVVFGQPKTHSEYIQATSRVGRTLTKPGFVVTLYNIHKPRDRSHYERFGTYHGSFYRHVEPTSSTPFAARALDRGLAGMLVGLARQQLPELTPADGAEQIGQLLADLVPLRDRIVKRALEQAQPAERQALKDRLEGHCKDLLDKWEQLATKYTTHGGHLRYQAHEGKEGQPLLYGFLDDGLDRVDARHRSFRASRSMRDVEPAVNVWVKTLDGIELDGDDV